jgi:hypothetical protein
MRTLFLYILFLLPILSISQNVHESLKFDIKFGFIKGGEVYFKLSDSTYQDSEVLNARLYGYTTGFAHMLYKVNDSFESIINKSNLYPIKSTKKISEKDYEFYNEVQYYHHRDSAYSHETGWHEIMPGVCDVSSLFYKLRYSGILDTLKKGDIIDLPFWDTGEWYIVEMKYGGTETIKTNFGKKECMVLKPLNIDGKFFNKKDPMVVWLTNDKRRLPVLLKMNFNIGSVKCELVES